ncbi:MAG TPA: NADH-ubiquinone oxidoreductase-F iron-sulfur binding region domain-containing protein [Solirubrobacteraceae bacterium]|jgi:NADH:ubiquinone oxidoreductase subunit F (NADH-binding)
MSRSFSTAELSTADAATRVYEGPPQPAKPDGAGSLPRLLRGVPAAGDALGLGRHLDVHGELPHERRRRRSSAAELIEQVERAGLRGRGGAAFPTGAKLRAVAARRGRPIVVVNAAEGEPASDKDRVLCQLAPHLMLDGAVAVAHALGAREAILGICESSSATETLARAIAERGAGDGIQIELATVPAGYVAGQESALISHLNGGQALPTFTPPMPFEQGVRRRPTMLSNAETFANIALIARHGPDWFRALGTGDQPGSTLVTLSGSLAAPAVYEIEYGTSLRALIDAAGGLLAPARAVLLGGYAGTWVDGAVLADLALSDAQLARHGASLGAGVVTLLSDAACPVAETARVTRWLAGESAGQCGPCVHGLGALAGTISELAAGVASHDAEQRVETLSQLVSRRGACAHPDGTARFALSAIEVFRDEFADHARHGACDRCSAPAELPLPEHERVLPRSSGRARASARSGSRSRVLSGQWAVRR